MDSSTRHALGSPVRISTWEEPLGILSSLPIKRGRLEVKRGAVSCDARTLEAKAGGLPGIQGQTALPSELQASLGSRARLHLTKRKQDQKGF